MQGHKKNNKKVPRNSSEQQRCFDGYQYSYPAGVPALKELAAVMHPFLGPQQPPWKHILTLCRPSYLSMRIQSTTIFLLSQYCEYRPG